MLAETAIDTFKTLLRNELPTSLGIKAYYTSERSLHAVQSYPCVIILCSDFTVKEYFSDYIDADYQMIIACMAINQDTEILRQNINEIMEEIIKAIIRSEDTDFEYTIAKNLVVNFGPIFTSATEQFIADAQVRLIARRKLAEQW